MTEITVREADREAAVELAHALGISCEDFTSGAADILVQHLVRHAAQAWLEAIEEAAKVAIEANARGITCWDAIRSLSTRGDQK